MKKLLATFCLAFICTCAIAQQSATQQRAIMLRRAIERNHLDPRPVNDSFSTHLFSQIFQTLDPRGLLFTQEDIKSLSPFRFRLDNELEGTSWGFTDALQQTYARARQRAEGMVKSILSKPLDFTADEKATLHSTNEVRFASNDADLQAKWTRSFKWQFLNTIFDAAKAGTPPVKMAALLPKQESVVRQKLLRVALSSLSRQQTPGEINNFIAENYLECIALGFDPHTNFFSATQFAGFQSALSTESGSYGFLVDEKDGRVVVGNLVPGGSAWRSGSIHRDDQLLEMQFDRHEAVDILQLSAEEAAELLADGSTSTLNLKLRKADGTLSRVSLRREKTETEENKVKGYILKGTRAIGYISLPDFYTHWAGEQGAGCAEDVARAIINLKREGIEGLILDVRFNGGGSMEEAQQLIGIFVDEGPLFAVREKSGKPRFLKDPNRSTIWDGPLVVMINGESASASESLAGGLQDYHRAVIAGSSSYGKATMQRIFPIDSLADERSMNSESGLVKITVGKLYRLDGSTVQLQGVHPDILLPDPFEVFPIGERESPNALASDTIARNKYYQPLPALPISVLAGNSSNRLASDNNFIAIRKTIADWRNSFTKGEIVSLRTDGFEDWRSHKTDPGTGSAIKSGSALFTPVPHQREQQRLQSNAYAAELDAAFRKELHSDPYVEECYRIVDDLIQLTTKKP